MVKYSKRDFFNLLIFRFITKKLRFILIYEIPKVYHLRYWNTP